MFENIIGRAETVATLTSELKRGDFPRAVLFFGPPYGGKLSTALEASRVLTCRTGGGEWACECQSCRMQRELAHPYTLVLGSRYFDVEIAASADALLRSPRTATRYLLLRAVRKLTRRFDPVAWDADDARIKGSQEKVSRIEEMLQEISMVGEPPQDAAGKGLEKTLQKIVEACAELAATVKNDHITIGQVRKLSAWAHITATDTRKIAVIENADRMQESARNALLKLLEDPPEGVHLFLLAARRSAIIPTILSRLRPYGFPPRDPRDEKEVLERIFRDESGRYASLRAFFLAWKEIKSEELARLSRRFLEMATEGNGPAPDVLKELEGLFYGKNQRDREAALSFLEELAILMHRALRREIQDSPLGADLDALEGWNSALKEAQSRIELFNMSPQTAIESLFLRMRA